ncbi:bifunctional aspartate kinase/homoserine dehydrogenase I [Ochrovirga pacifica]|uniref:bifunctional aspartate kinase/homoserine dehydrogenase I n=1 Tax=Ochrovirga pacifica TaxID=1042376 RepID=UPI0002559883|nr:bifunctional aspartate kinase/homoserine dehydrogenase I [Ochrovirga pacifica]
MKILKFGGTSIASAQNIERVIDILKNNSQQIAVVFSAINKTTDALIAMANKAQQQDDTYTQDLAMLEQNHFDIVRELIPVNSQGSVLSGVKKRINELENILEGVSLLQELSAKTKDTIVSYGEFLSTFIITKALQCRELDAIYKNSGELIISNSNFGNASVIQDLTENNIKEYFSNNSHNITVLPGFIACNPAGEKTTLGRGGSDYTAAIIAAALEVEQLEIWTDVSGMYTANPKLVKQAKPIEKLSYSEAMELSHFGASVLYPPTVQPVMHKNIPLYIKNTFSPEDPGSFINDQNTQGDALVKGISHIDNIALATVEGNGLIGIPGVSKRLFSALSEKEVNVILITQASSEHSICIAIDMDDVEKAELAIQDEFAYELSLGKIDPLHIETKMAIVAIVGEEMKSHQGISGKMFSALGKDNVNIHAIAQGASERNISTVIDSKNVTKALNSLHEEFFEEHITKLNLFIVGVGNVGGKLIEQIEQQKDYLLDTLQLNIQVVGMANSKKMIFDAEGLDLTSDWKQHLIDCGEELNLDLFLEHVKEMNLINSVFVDNTANATIAGLYADYLKESIAVVTCNKIAASSEYSIYARLKKISQEYNAPYLFETNVGAGLPIINTLNNLVQSGDRIKKIQAVASGSLNFIFNSFVGDANFAEIVDQAGALGYTEPDPRIDLSGVDVARKILILARESGAKMNLEDIENISFLPTSSLEAASVEDFKKTLIAEEAHFNKIKDTAAANNTQLKYVAEYKEGKANVSLQEVDAQHPFYNLQGSDNIVLFFTERYPEFPLIVKGAGAGADVTASGIFADIIRIGRG